MEEGQLKFVIVGHVDHGKSTLIGRFLYDTKSLPPDRIREIEKSSRELGRETEFAFLLDHFQEEREQGITIDTTQTFFKTPKRQYIIIDAPGHVEFIKNMITGASQAEAAVLIIDVTQGVKEQTRRHAYILSLIGLRQLIVVVNKMDLVAFKREKFEEVKAEAEKLLAGLSIHTDFWIPIAALKGDNVVAKSKEMAWYNGHTVLTALEQFQSRPSLEEMPFVFPVQDVYLLGSQRMIVGRVASGTLQTGEKVKVLPSGFETSVKSLNKFNTHIENAGPQESIGIELEDSLFLDRGMVLSRAKPTPRISDSFKAEIFWMAKAPFEPSLKLTLRCSTQSISCSIKSIHRKINSSTLELIEDASGQIRHLEVAEVEIKTKKPLVVDKFENLQELGRFILVHQNDVCAGGIITGIL